MMNIEKYKTFSTQDFVLDEHFRELVEGKLEPHYSFLQLKEDIPEKSGEIDLALKILNALHTPFYEHSEAQKNELWGKVVAKRGRQIRLNIFRHAAVVFLIIGIGSFTLYLSQSKSSIEDFASRQNIQSSNDVSLVLADGERIDIDRKESKIQYKDLGASIFIDDTVSLKQKNIAEGFNQMIVPYGKRSHLLLSDGTQVWINSGSRLVYASQFKGDIREVFLEGEAYFEVAKDTDKPFYVRTDAFKIKVLGTKFNVKAYKDDLEHNAVLVEGKVSMKASNQFFSKEVILSPNQKSTFTQGEDDFQITNVDETGLYTNWIYGYLEFKRANLSDVLKSISRYYNIDIQLKTSNQAKIVSGKLDLKTEPERILDGLSLLTNTKFMKEGGKYVIYE